MFPASIDPLLNLYIQPAMHNSLWHPNIEIYKVEYSQA